MKKCPGCDTEKPLDEFYLDVNRPDGVTVYCRDCSSDKQRARYAADPEPARKRGLDYYYANREKVLARLAAEREADREGWNAERRDRRASMTPEQRERYLAAKRQSARRHRGLILDELWEAQDGLCYLCEEPLPPGGSRSLHIDHDHACCPAGRSCPECRRGLTHNGCNTAIGLMGEDPAKLRLVADNLEHAMQRRPVPDAA